jgi:hypothetical protein
MHIWKIHKVFAGMADTSEGKIKLQASSVLAYGEALILTHEDRFHHRSFKSNVYDQ